MTAALVQNSPEWIAARVGRFGASELGALMAKGEGKTRASLIRRKAAERITGAPQGWKGNAATESGHEQEPHAVRALEERLGVFTEAVGLVVHPAYPFTHASPDRFIGDDTGVEIKSHVEFLAHWDAIEGKPPIAHVYQCQWGMACTGRRLWIYAHYCHAAPDPHRLFVFPTMERDDAMIAKLAVAIQEAEKEVSALVASYAARTLIKEAA